MNNLVKLNEGNSFLTIKGEENERAIKQAIALEALLFINLSYPSTNAELISKELAKELFDRKNWKLQDVKEFFRFIKDNATKKEFQVIGNSIGMMHFMRFIILYEEKKSEERESRYQVHKNAESAQPLPVPKEWIEKILKTIKSNTKKVEYNGKAGVIENAFNPITNEEHFKVLTTLIPEFNTEEKEESRKKIEKLNPSTESEVNRMTELLKLLK